MLWYVRFMFNKILDTKKDTQERALFRVSNAIHSKKISR